MARSTVTPLYFHPETTTATPDTPEPATPAVSPAVEVASKAQTAVEQASNTRAGTRDENSGESDGQGLVPFSNWSMNRAPGGFTMMHHEFKTALPVFTPDPPILHGEVPEAARGKELVLEVVIDDQGSIIQATVLHGVGPGVENSIMETLRRWIFVPAKVNGVAIASRRQLRFQFPG